mgnify:FL=1
MANPAENKEGLKTAILALRDVVLKTAFSYRRSLSADILMVELGVFSDEAAKMRELSRETSTIAGSMVLINHETGKLLLAKPRLEKDLALDLAIEIRIYMMRMTSPRRLRQDKSIGLIITAVPDEQSALTSIAALLIEEKDPTSPAGVMIITTEGSHLFFRTFKTIEQTKSENDALIYQKRGFSMGDFAKLNHLAHFYCPSSGTIATPVVI